MKWDGNQYSRSMMYSEIGLEGVNHNHGSRRRCMWNKCVFNEAINSCGPRDHLKDDKIDRPYHGQSINSLDNFQVEILSNLYVDRMSHRVSFIIASRRHPPPTQHCQTTRLKTRSMISVKNANEISVIGWHLLRLNNQIKKEAQVL